MPDEPVTDLEALTAANDAAMTAGVDDKIAAAVAEGKELNQEGQVEGEEPTKKVEETATEEVATEETTEEVKTAEEEATEEALEETAEIEEATIDATEEVKAGVPRRVRVEGLPEVDRFKTQAAAAHARAKGIPITVAMKQLYPEDFEEPQEVEQTQEVTEDPELTTAKTDLATLDAELDAAGEDHSLFTPELRSKLKKQSELQRKVDRLTDRQEQQQAAAEHEAIQREGSAYQQGFAASEAVVEQLFPGHMADDKSPLTNAVLAEMTEIRKAGKNHRDYGRVDLPEILFAKHAAKLGIAPAKPGAAPVKKGATTVSRVLPKAGGAGGRPGELPNSDQQAAKREHARAEAVRTGDLETLTRMNDEDLTGKPMSEKSDLIFA